MCVGELWAVDWGFSPVHGLLFANPHDGTFFGLEVHAQFVPKWTCVVCARAGKRKLVHDQHFVAGLVAWTAWSHCHKSNRKLVLPGCRLVGQRRKLTKRLRRKTKCDGVFREIALLTNVAVNGACFGLVLWTLQLQLQLQRQLQLHYSTLHYATSTPRYTYNYNFNCDRSCSCNYNYNSTTLRSTVPHYNYHYHYATPHYNYNYNYNYNNYYSYNYNYSNSNYSCNDNRTTLQLQLRLQLHYTTLRHTTSSSSGWGDLCNHCKKHNSNHLSVHQWIRSAVHASQELTSLIISYPWIFRHRLVRHYW